MKRPTWPKELQKQCRGKCAENDTAVRRRPSLSSSTNGGLKRPTWPN